jgi:fatty-acyl-CoA synthase
VPSSATTRFIMAEVTICHGLTETSPVATQSRREDDLGRRVSTVVRRLAVTAKVRKVEMGQIAIRGLGTLAE